ncbi:hypothetical protein [Schlesneria sp. DSM 10557]|uniref:hypothetical protein n=1 Tax=Schlesneria sp. DSM 10557 TaxID=3044399 RepID=UPI0035A116D1
MWWLSLPAGTTKLRRSASLVLSADGFNECWRVFVPDELELERELIAVMKNACYP